tara:strand:+ start:387 stop:608 length:222 start_codon:yes stop_codon:yes gene_type:complete
VNEHYAARLRIHLRVLKNGTFLSDLFRVNLWLSLRHFSLSIVTRRTPTLFLRERIGIIIIANIIIESSSRKRS